jgi:nitroimidazol reductase NimA-like FMN-containing flavoprotein (pyridoxamine 5'-phosphate oxidase superfamily)
MTLELTTQLVWEAIEKELFAVLGMVNAKNQARTVGIVYVVQNQKLYIVTGTDTWKARHVRNNPNVSITVTIPKRIPIMPWVTIPAATITFSGKANVLSVQDVSQELLHALFRGQESDLEKLGTMCVIEVEPQGDFVTYGVGISLMQMRHPEKSRGRAPVKEVL